MLTALQVERDAHGHARFCERDVRGILLTVARFGRQTTAGFALALLSAGCTDDGPSYDATLSDIAGELRVSVEVLGTRDPATPRRIQIFLQPGPSATIDQERLCPLIEANASVNGLALKQTEKGEYFSSSGGGGILSGSAGCRPISFDLALPEELPPALLEEPARVQLRDSVGAVNIEARGLFHPPTARFSEPADGMMHPGDTVELLVEPSVAMLPPRLSGYYTAEVPGDSFGLGEIEITETGVVFGVIESAVPSRGTVKLTGDRSGPFRAIIDKCEGAASCSAARSICYDSYDCRTGVAYGGGFDSLILPASVVAETDD